MQLNFEQVARSFVTCLHCNEKYGGSVASIPKPGIGALLVTPGHAQSSLLDHLNLNELLCV